MLLAISLGIVLVGIMDIIMRIRLVYKWVVQDCRSAIRYT